MRSGGFLDCTPGVGRGALRIVYTQIGFRLSLSLAVVACAGCATLAPIEREQLDRGLVMVLPGVECYASHHVGLAQGLKDAGVDRAIEVRVWGTHPFGTFPNLLSYQLNRRRAAGIAEELVQYRSEHPSQPIALIGFSGGGAMALFTAEALPPDFRLERIILMGAAISPTYDFRPSLAHCERGIVNFYSSQDWLMIGLGTQVFGTMDRQKTCGAGRYGFLDEHGGLRTEPGLKQIAWRPEWRHWGNWGYHSSWRAEAWAREVLAGEVMSDPKASLGG